MSGSVIFHALLLVSSLSLATAKCPLHFEPWYDGVCGFRLTEDNELKLNYTDAASVCASLNASLPAVKSPDVSAALAQIASPNFFLWMGLTCTNTSAGPVFSWDDGSDVFFSNFDGPFYGNASFCDSSKYRYYFYAPSQKWYADKLSDDLDVVLCTTKATDEELCDDFPLSTNTSCYKHFSQNASWLEAEESCHENGAAHLASIHSGQDNDFIRRTALAHGAVSGVHVGLTRNASAWSWSDGTMNDYNNFAQGEPSSNASCVSLQPHDGGRWRGEDCSSARQPFICERRAPTLKPAACPDRPIYAGEEIYAPSYPLAGAAGDCFYYVFSSSAEKNVAVRVESFTTYRFGQTLALYDELGLIQTLSGTIPRGETFASRRPSMFLVWNSTKSLSVSGFHLSVIDQ